MANKSKWHIWSAQWAVRALKNMANWSDAARYRVGTSLAWLASKFAKRRMNIARTNLSLCFPSWTDEQVERVAYRDLAVGDGYQARFVQLLEQVADCGLR